jgi:hypothetical protein
MARSALEEALGTKLDCQGELDPEMNELLTTLQRRGRRGRVTLKDEDGRIVASRRVASRRGASLRLLIKESGSKGKIEASMPWAVAECLLGRSMSLDQALDHGRQPITVKITGENGRSFEVRLD